MNEESVVVATEQPKPKSVKISNTFKIVVSLGWLVFNATLIVLIMVYGQSSNSLHTSGLAWAFVNCLAVMAGYGIGAMSSLVETILKK